MTLPPSGFPDTDCLLAAQRSLLAPVAGGRRAPVEAWAASVTASVRAVAGCAHTLFVLPVGRPGGRAIQVYSDDSDPSVPLAVEAAFNGTWGEDPTWADAHIAAGYEARRRGGPGAYHERDLTTRGVVERSPIFQEALSPSGLRYALWLAVPFADGREFSIGAYYEQEGDPSLSAETLTALSLLVPAFEAGAQAFLQRGPDAAAPQDGVTAVADAIGRAVLVIDEDGGDVHWNVPLVRLLEAEGRDGRLLALVRQWAHYVSGRPPFAGPPAATVRGARGAYRLRGVRLADGPEGVGGVVAVEPVGLPLPEPRALRDHFGLTRREAEVAALLAQGLTDRRIADELSVSHSTARRHTERVLRKLEAGSRAAVAQRLCEAM